jgi:two-component system, OmpR family, response regulator
MNRTPHILIVDDDPKIRNGLSKFLTEQGLRITTASDGRDMQAKLANASIDLIILDVMMPGEDGLSLCRKFSADDNVPVILLTALAAETDRIIGLEIGAEDYVCKPFSPRELLARIRVVLRRKGHAPPGHPKASSTRYSFSGWTLDIRARTLTSATGGHVELTTGEFDLLQAFVDHPNVVLNRDQLLDLARGRASLTIDRAIDVQVMRLRRKLELDPQSPQLIKTVRNSGYIFTPDVRSDDGQP